MVTNKRRNRLMSFLAMVSMAVTIVAVVVMAVLSL